mgnify:CR=1 FL=1|tara:strand:- start:26 stop:205 length:180 start_codon:yes stop_codon:yes gene_type:complete
MPKVGNKEFSYDAAGKKAAAMEAKKTDQEMVSAYKKGGKIKVRGTGAAINGLFARGPMG